MFHKRVFHLLFLNLTRTLRRLQPPAASRFSLALLVMLAVFVASCNSSGGGGSSSSSAGGSSSTTDPLYSYQWHLKNTGQTAFAYYSGTSGEDINMSSTDAKGYNGTGIKVAVVDSGLEIAHEDLVDNVDSGASWDFANSDTDPTPSATTGDHGTSVAGLIAMRDSNGKGGRGVSPRASLVGYNFLASQTTSNEVASLGGSTSSPNSSNVDIFNMSYGYNLTYDTTLNSTIENQLKSGFTSLRGGKGAIYVKSAGNGFYEYGSASCSAAQGVPVTCQNANMDPENTTPWTIIVGALDARGIAATYSTAGSSIWVSAPGGESGYYYCSSTYQCRPAMITTDQSGCDKGYSISDPSLPNFFEDNFNGLNPSCNYTSMFNGTSSAAPVLSGAIALLLQANDNLTVRDIKYILAKTAEKVHSSSTGTWLGSYKAELGWTTNAANYNFHNWYGFGRVDVDAAVTMAESYTSHLATSDLKQCSWRSSGTLSLSIPDYSSTGASNTISVGDSLTSIEAVQIKVSATHTATGDLAIELTSPSNTKSILLNIRNGFGSSNDLSGMVLLSNAFFGESSNGSWTIKLVDGASNDTGTLTNWQIRVFGQGTCSS